MINVFTAVSILDEITNDYTYLGELDGRYYYVSTDYIERLFKRRGKLADKKIFYDELNNSEHGLLTTLECWLDVIEADILHLTVDEVEQFLELYAMKSSEDLFINLGEPNEDGSKTAGEIIFVNSLADLIQRGRN